VVAVRQDHPQTNQRSYSFSLVQVLLGFIRQLGGGSFWSLFTFYQPEASVIDRSFDSFYFDCLFLVSVLPFTRHHSHRLNIHSRPSIPITTFFPSL